MQRDWSKSVNGREHLRDLSTDGKKQLERMLRQILWRSTEFEVYGTVTDFCEQGKEPSGFIKALTFWPSL